jgi:hypothetical protein
MPTHQSCEWRLATAQFSRKRNERLRTFSLYSQEFLHLLFYLQMMERDIRDVPVAGNCRNMQEKQLTRPAFQ